MGLNSLAMQLLWKRGATIRVAAWIFFVLTLYSNQGLTQDTSKALKPVFGQTSLFYDFPESFGITSGLQLPLKSINKTITSKKGETFTKQRDIITGINAGFYRYPYNYTGVTILPFIGRRRYYSATFFTETSLGIGVLRTFYDGRVYKLNAAGDVTEVGLFGRFYATTNLSWGFNWFLKNPKIALQLTPSLWFQFPYNSLIKPHASLEAGIKYELVRRTVMVKSIHKNRRR